MKNMDKEQDLLKKAPIYPEKSDDQGNICPEYVKKIQRIMKQDRVKIKDIDQYF